jgi:hypothetical protein
MKMPLQLMLNTWADFACFHSTQNAGICPLKEFFHFFIFSSFLNFLFFCRCFGYTVKWLWTFFACQMSCFLATSEMRNAESYLCERGISTACQSPRQPPPSSFCYPFINAYRQQQGRINIQLMYIFLKRFCPIHY